MKKAEALLASCEAPSDARALWAADFVFGMRRHFSNIRLPSQDQFGR
jgi:hypothetical protein